MSLAIGERDWIETTLQRGVRMRLSAGSRVAPLIHSGEYEREERAFLNAFLRPGDVFVDAGAHAGLFTLIAARCVGAGGSVHALEPCLQTYNRLLANVELNELGNVACHRLALSDRAVRLDLNVSLDGFDVCNSFAHPVMGDSFATETVECTTWDGFAREHGLVGRVTMLKIDVEGWETRVLAGGRETLSCPDAPVLQVEFADAAARSAGTSCADLYRLLESLGYRMFVCSARTGGIAPDPLREQYEVVNLVAAKRPEWVAARLGRSGLAIAGQCR